MNINEIIEKQMVVLKRLDSLLDAEKEILIKEKASEIPNITEAKKLIAREIAVIENSRIKLYGENKAEDLVVEGLLRKETLDELIDLVQVIQGKQETNMALTKQSLYYIRTIVNSISPVQPNVTYGSNGQVGDIKTTNIFTTKA